MFVEHHLLTNYKSVTMKNDALCTPSVLGKCKSSLQTIFSLLSVRVQESLVQQAQSFRPILGSLILQKFCNTSAKS